MSNLKTTIKTSAISLALLSSANAFADIQHLDDVIISFSLCVGNDCANGESFGFDTIRMKENNIRIKAQDTSSSASFPTNDWQITFNDSSNGGANKFSIDDIDGGRTPFTIEAGARSNSLYVENDGDVGLGTSSPVVNLHVVDGNTPTLRLEQDGSSGFTPQTWDLAGNEANFFVRDATNGSKLPFKIKPGAPTSSVFIAADGDIGLGDESPDAALDVESGNILISDGKLGIGSNTPAGMLEIIQDSASSHMLRLLSNDGVTHVWSIKLAANGDLSFKKQGGSIDIMTLHAAGQINFNGNVFVDGKITTTKLTCTSPTVGDCP